MKTSKFLRHAAALSASVLCLSASALTVMPGNLIVQSQSPGSAVHTIRQYDLSGNELGSMTVPQPPGQTDSFYARDLAIGTNGEIYLFNGTFDPYLSTYNSQTDSWSHTTETGWSTINNVSYGGLALHQDTIFVTDMSTAGANDGASGIIAFDRNTGVATRFASATNPEDINIGLDGRLYALSGTALSIYDPDTLDETGFVNLSEFGDVRSVAADANGNLYAATWGRELFKLTAEGILLDMIDLPGSAIDIDISVDGILAVGTRLDGVFLTDTNFSFNAGFDNGDWNTFVTFTPVPVPGAAWLFGSALLWLAGRSRSTSATRV